MIPAAFEYVRADSVDAATSALTEHGEDAKLLAGGMSLIPLMKLRLAVPSVLVDVGRLDDLRYVRDAGDHLAIGALSRHRDLETDATLAAGCGVVQAVAAEVGDNQVRHRGTIGGSVAHGDPASDLPAVLLALDAEFVMRGPAGERTVAASDFFTGFLETALGPDELLTEIRVPKTGADGFSYQKFNRRAQDWAIVGAVAVRAAGTTRVGLVNMGATPVAGACGGIRARRRRLARRRRAGGGRGHRGVGGRQRRHRVPRAPRAGAHRGARWRRSADRRPGRPAGGGRRARRGPVQPVRRRQAVGAARRPAAAAVGGRRRHGVGPASGGDGGRSALGPDRRPCSRRASTWCAPPGPGRGSRTACAALVRALEGWRQVGAVCVGLGDQPGVGAEAYRRLAHAYDAGATLAVATYGGVRQNPVLIARPLWPRVGQLRGDVGARALMDELTVTEVDCTDTGSPADIDTPADLERVAREMET